MFRFNSLRNLIWLIKYRKNFKNWKKRNFKPPSPDFIKHQILKNNNLDESLWIETGTYYGETTKFLSKFARKVISVEADKRLSLLASKRFKKIDNITIINERSENILKKILNENIKYKNMCIYLDAHLCNDHITSSKTFGDEANATPIMDELQIIETELHNKTNINILIDDVRLFDESFQNYSKKIDLVNWCLKNNYEWKIEHDIFIARKKELS